MAQYCEIDRDNKNLQNKYMKFLFEVRKLLEQKQVSTDDLLFAWAVINKADVIPGRLGQASSIQSFLQALTLLTPEYFNYSVIADLAEHFGEEEGAVLVKSYESKLKEKLNKRIKTKITKRACKLVVKVEWENHRSPSQQKLVGIFRSTLSKLFGHGDEEFILKNVKEGCLEMTFLIPDAGMLQFKGIVNRNAELLKKLHVIVLTVNE